MKSARIPGVVGMVAQAGGTLTATPLTETLDKPVGGVGVYASAKRPVHEVAPPEGMLSQLRAAGRYGSYLLYTEEGVP
eukprot:14873144-Alexandrium_andersonii.AAC.1